MYKLGFLTLILCAVTSRQVICDDSGKCVASIVVCDNNCVASTVVCDNSNEIYDSNEIGGIDEIDDSGEIGGIDEIDDSGDSDDSDEIGEIGGIDDSDEIEKALEYLKNCETPTIIELCMSIDQLQAPKAISIYNEELKFSQSLIENPIPFLGEVELDQIQQNLRGGYETS